MSSYFLYWHFLKNFCVYGYKMRKLCAFLAHASLFTNIVPICSVEEFPTYCQFWLFFRYIYMEKTFVAPWNRFLIWYDRTIVLSEINFIWAVIKGDILPRPRHLRAPWKYAADGEIGRNYVHITNVKIHSKLPYHSIKRWYFSISTSSLPPPNLMKIRVLPRRKGGGGLA